MRKWTQDDLIATGHKIENARITSANLSMADHGVLTLDIGLDGGVWGCVYGGYVIGKGYLGASEFIGYASGLESIMRIMDVVGVSKFNDMVGKYVRVATIGLSSPIKIIGNVIDDKWFDITSFFEDKENEQTD